LLSIIRHIQKERNNASISKGKRGKRAEVRRPWSAWGVLKTRRIEGESMSFTTDKKKKGVETNDHGGLGREKQEGVWLVILKALLDKSNVGAMVCFTKESVNNVKGVTREDQANAERKRATGTVVSVKQGFLRLQNLKGRKGKKGRELCHTLKKRRGLLREKAQRGPCS